MTVKEIIESIDFNLSCNNDEIPTTQEDLLLIKSALEKQIPKKPVKLKAEQDIKIGVGTWKEGTTVYKCSCCNSFISCSSNYCPKCGQAIKKEGLKMICKKCIHNNVCTNQMATAIDNKCVIDSFKDKSRFVEFPLTAYVINEIKAKTDINTFITRRYIKDITINGISDISRTILFYGNIFFTKDEAKRALAVLNRGAAK